jgi:putative transcriptional regulator
MPPKRRNLFSELSEGFDALKQEREGKITLRKHAIQAKPASQVAAAELIASLARKNLSHVALFPCGDVAGQNETWPVSRARRVNAQSYLLSRSRF